MKSLSPANPRVLFVVGIPGAGKTYFAEQFAETFGAPFIEYDAIRAQLTQHPSYSRGRRNRGTPGAAPARGTAQD